MEARKAAKKRTTRRCAASLLSPTEHAPHAGVAHMSFISGPSRMAPTIEVMHASHIFLVWSASCSWASSIATRSRRASSSSAPPTAARTEVPFLPLLDTGVLTEPIDGTEDADRMAGPTAGGMRPGIGGADATLSAQRGEGAPDEDIGCCGTASRRLEREAASRFDRAPAEAVVGLRRAAGVLLLALVVGGQGGTSGTVFTADQTCFEHTLHDTRAHRAEGA